MLILNVYKTLKLPSTTKLEALTLIASVIASLLIRTFPTNVSTP